MNDEAISPREVLRTAANATGGEEELAALLEIDLTELKAWLDGTRPPPFGTCIDALAISERHRQPLVKSYVAFSAWDPQPAWQAVVR